jgi:hypothetical protein
MKCKKNTEFTVNGTLTIPKHIPDIDFILRVTSTPIIEKTSTLDKQITFSGHVIICIEFVSSKPGSTQTVHFISFEDPFISLINHRHVRSGLDCQLSASIKHQEFQLINPKSINKLIEIKVCILRVTKSCNNANSHCSEPRLALLCTPDKLKTRPSTHRSTQTITPNDDHHEIPPFTDFFHIPSSQHLESTDNNNEEYDNTISYNACEYQLD